MDFGRLITAMITPFGADGMVDYNQAQHLAAHLYDNGSQSLVIAGTTGESPTLSEQEKLKLFSCVKEVAKGRGYVIAGTSSYNTAESVAMTRAAAKAGADGILAVAPYYNKPPQEGLYNHFTAIASACDLPVMLYNIPGRTGINVQPQTVARLSKIDNIFAVKEASGNMEQVSAILQLVDDDFLIYSGDDSLTLPIMSLGGYGIVSVAGHIIGKEIKSMIDMYLAGDYRGAAEMNKYLYPVFHNIFITTSPIPIKYCVNKLGFNVGDCRLPLCPAEGSLREILDNMLRDMDIKNIDVL